MSTNVSAPAELWGPVAKAVIERRTKFGWTQEDLAAEAGVSPTSVQNLENAAKTSYRALTLSKIALALNWPPDAWSTLLLGGEVDTTKDHLPEQFQEARLIDLEDRLARLEKKVDELRGEQ